MAQIAGLQDFRGAGPPGDIGTYQMPCTALVFQFTFSGVTTYVAIRAGDRGWVLVSQGTVPSTVIQAALNNLSAGRTWKEKVVVKGNFVQSATITLPSYAVLEIQGKLTLADNSPAGTTMLYSVTQTNIEIVGGILDGNMANQAGGLHATIIDLVNVSDVLIKDVKTVNASYDHIWLQGTTRDVVIDGWIGDGARDDGFNPLGTTSNVVVKNSIARNMACDGFHISNDTTDISIIGCLSHNNGIHGIGILKSLRAVIIGNIIHDNAECGIYLGGADDSYVKIMDNQIFSNTLRGIFSDAPHCDYASILGNTVQGGTDGIRLENSLYSIINGNIIHGVGGNALVLTGGASYGYHIVTNNHITNGVWDGIYVNNNYNLIAYNIILTVVNRSVEEAGGIDHNVITHNEVTQAMTIVGANTKVQGNKGWVTENTVLSPAFAIDAVALVTVTIPHGLAVTPAIQDCSLTIVEDSNVDDWGYNLVKVDNVGAVNVVAKVNVSVASATGGATAKLSLRVGKA